MKDSNLPCLTPPAISSARTWSSFGRFCWIHLSSWSLSHSFTISTVGFVGITFDVSFMTGLSPLKVASSSTGSDMVLVLRVLLSTLRVRLGGLDGGENHEGKRREKEKEDIF